MQDNEKKPALRFKGFTDPWEQRKLDEIANFSKGVGYSKNDLCEEGTPIILYGRLYTKYETSIFDVDTFVKEKAGSVYSKGGEVIVPASGETAEDISIASVVVKPGILLGGDLNIVSPTTEYDSAFLALTISSGAAHEYLSSLAQGKSVVHLHNADIQSVSAKFPTKREQEKIHLLFGKIDTLITLHQRKYEKLVNIKKSMLDKMFPQNGASVPEIRFKGFTDPWEQRKVGTLIEDYTEKTVTQNQYPVLTSSQQQGIVLQEDYFADRQVTTDNNVGYYVLPKGYFTYRSRSDTDVFVFNRNNIVDKGIISYYYPVFAPKSCDSNFLLRRLNHGIKKQLSMAAEGTGQKVLAHAKFKNMVVDVPSQSEQEKIGTILEELDTLITLHQRKLEKLQNIKKSCLEKMFV